MARRGATRMYVVTEVRRSPKNLVETQRGRALAPIPLAQPGLTHCPAHTQPQWFPSRTVEERGFQIARRSYFPLGRRAPRSSTALYPRAMLSLRCAVRQQPNTILTMMTRGKTTIPDHHSVQFSVVSLTRCAHACVLFVGFLNVLRARGNNHSSPASVYATGLSGIASEIVSRWAGARQE